MMKFVQQRTLGESEAAHAYTPDEAVRLFQCSLDNHDPIDGLADLRGNMTTSFDFDVIDQLKKGEWRLVDKAAYGFDWARLNAWVNKEKLQTRAMALTEVPKNIVGTAICVFTSYRREPLKFKTCAHGEKETMETKQSTAAGMVDCLHHSHNDRMVVQIGH
jgi:hypothetical protein